MINTSHEPTKTLRQRFIDDMNLHRLSRATQHSYLREWWKVGRKQGMMYVDGWLFPGQHCLKPICYRQVYRIAAEAAHAAGITKRVGLHTLRHSFFP